MRVLIVTGDRNAAKYKLERERWTAAINAVIDETFGPDGLGMIITGSSAGGVHQITNEVALERSLLIGNVAIGKLIQQARHLRATGMDVSVAVFHDNVFFSRSSRQVMEEANLHGFQTVVVTSHGHVKQAAA